MMHCRDALGGRFSAEALTAGLEAVVAQGLSYPFEQLAIDLRKQEGDSAALSGAAAEAAEARARTVSGELRTSFGDDDPVGTANDRFAEVASELAERHGVLVAAAKEAYRQVVASMKALCSFCGERADPKVRKANLPLSAVAAAGIPAEIARSAVSGAQGGDALLEALSSLFAQIARERPLPPPAPKAVKSDLEQIKEETAMESAREEKAKQVAREEAERAAASELELRDTLTQIDALRTS
jgi:hypothetical protein